MNKVVSLRKTASELRLVPARNWALGVPAKGAERVTPQAANRNEDTSSFLWRHPRRISRTRISTCGAATFQEVSRTWCQLPCRSLRIQRGRGRVRFLRRSNPSPGEPPNSSPRLALVRASPVKTTQHKEPRNQPRGSRRRSTMHPPSRSPSSNHPLWLDGGRSVIARGPTGEAVGCEGQCLRYDSSYGGRRGVHKMAEYESSNSSDNHR